jgi:hypothetical protein
MTALVAEPGDITARGMCKRCAGLMPAHFLTCPTLRLPSGFRLDLVSFQDAPRGKENGTRTE